MLSKSQKTFSSLRNEEWRALKELRNVKEITIKPADKGGAVVVLNTTDYVTECNRQLNNTSYYLPLDHDPTNKYTKDIDVTLKRGVEDKEIDSDIAKALIVTHP